MASLALGRSLLPQWPTFSLAIPSIQALLDLFPPFLLAVPKSKTSHSRKAMRSANKGLKDKHSTPFLSDTCAFSNSLQISPTAPVAVASSSPTTSAPTATAKSRASGRPRTNRATWTSPTSHDRTHAHPCVFCARLLVSSHLPSRPHAPRKSTQHAEKRFRAAPSSSPASPWQGVRTVCVSLWLAVIKYMYFTSRIYLILIVRTRHRVPDLSRLSHGNKAFKRNCLLQASLQRSSNAPLPLPQTRSLSVPRASG